MPIDRNRDIVRRCFCVVGLKRAGAGSDWWPGQQFMRRNWVSPQTWTMEILSCTTSKQSCTAERLVLLWAVQLLGTRPSTSVCTLSCPSLQDKWVGQSQKRPARTTTTTSSMGVCCNTSALTKNKQEDPQIKLATLWAWLTACGHVWWRVGYFFKVPSAASLHSTRYRSDLKPEISQQQQQQLLYNMLKELASAWELLKFRYQVSSTLLI